MASNVVEILRKIREGYLSPNDVPIHHRRICVAYLRCEGYTQMEIAEIFNVHRQTIIRDERANRKELAKLVNDIDVRSIAGGLIHWARQFTAKAIREKDYALAWRIQRDLVADLQSLGYLPRAPEQHQVQVATFVELVSLATEQMQGAASPLLDEEQKLLPGPATDNEQESNGSNSQETEPEVCQDSR
jgi:hypothetical protein